MPIHDQFYRKLKGIYFYCGVKTKRKIGRHNKYNENLALLATVDHYIPKSFLPKGFDPRDEGNEENMVLACFACNVAKGDKLPENWDGKLGPYRYLEGRGWVWEGYET